MRNNVLVPRTDEPPLSLRERRRRRTRAALVEAGGRLFEERGYDETTIADIAEAAEIGTRTFFHYFESKEQLLFPASDWRVQAALNAIGSRVGTETPAQVLLRALDDATADDELISPLAQLRLRLIRDVPAVQARALRLQLQAQHDISTALTNSYPGFTEVDATALVGAFIGAVSGAIQALPQAARGKTNDIDRKKRLRQAVATALGQG